MCVPYTEFVVVSVAYEKIKPLHECGGGGWGARVNRAEQGNAGGEPPSIRANRRKVNWALRSDKHPGVARCGTRTRTRRSVYGARRGVLAWRGILDRQIAGARAVSEVAGSPCGPSH
jgi:hypothetical protein